MARIIKSVSLDPKTAQIAAHIGNFSAFVRDALLQYEAHYDAAQTHAWDEDARIGGLCLGVGPTYCRACYPHGPAPKEAWLAYRADPQGVGQAWLQAQAVKANENEWRLVPNMQTPGPGHQAPKRAPGLLGRLLGRG